MSKAVLNASYCAMVLGLLAGIPCLLSNSSAPFIARREFGYTKTSVNGWRSSPLHIPPTHDFEGTISHEELRAVALRVVPRWKVVKVHQILHALRLWGYRCDFDFDYLTNPSRMGIPSGARMLSIVLDDRVLHETLVPCDSVLLRTASGIGVEYGTSSSPAHCDQLLKVTSEIDLPADAPVHPRGGPTGTVNDIIRESLDNFVIDQELEFTAVAYSRWLPPYDRWTNRFGETTTFDDLADKLIEKPLGEGACFGAHVPYALANILRANQCHHVVGPEVVVAIEQRLGQISRLLEKNQADNGAWFEDWARVGSHVRTGASRTTFDAVLSTGHHLEWMALVPDRLRPDRQAVMKAIRLLSRTIPMHDTTSISHPRSFGAFSHAARALMLLEGVDAADVIIPADASRSPGSRNR